MTGFCRGTPTNFTLGGKWKKLETKLCCPPFCSLPTIRKCLCGFLHFSGNKAHKIFPLNARYVFEKLSLCAFSVPYHPLPEMSTLLVQYAGFAPCSLGIVVIQSLFSGFSHYISVFSHYFQGLITIFGKFVTIFPWKQ